MKKVFHQLNGLVFLVVNKVNERQYKKSYVFKCLTVYDQTLRGNVICIHNICYRSCVMRYSLTHLNSISYVFQVSEPDTVIYRTKIF